MISNVEIKKNVKLSEHFTLAEMTKTSVVSFGLLTKKDIAFRRCLPVGVPGRTRTVDIQNHNLTL